MYKIFLSIVFFICFNVSIFASSKEVVYNLYLKPGVLVCADEDKFKDWFNFLSARDFDITDSTYNMIKADGGTSFTKSYRPARILKVSKTNNRLVMIEYLMDYDNQVRTEWWTHRRFLITEKEFESQFI